VGKEVEKPLDYVTGPRLRPKETPYWDASMEARNVLDVRSIKSDSIRLVLFEPFLERFQFRAVKGTCERPFNISNTRLGHSRSSFQSLWRSQSIPNVPEGESWGQTWVRPAPGVVKQLKIQYRINGKEGEVTFQENPTIMLPVPK
jgi:hypothetical protein